MYNALTNEWKHEEHQMTYDVRQPKTQAYVLDKLRRWIAEHQHGTQDKGEPDCSAVSENNQGMSFCGAVYQQSLSGGYHAGAVK